MQKYRIIIIELLQAYEKRLHRFVDYFYDDEDQYQIFPVHRELLINEEPSEKELELLNQLYALLPEATDEELRLISEDINTYYRSWYNLTPLLQERLKRGDKEAEEKQAYLLEWNSITDDTWDGVDDGSDETPEEI
jgi:tRNA 2-selenouridine synthase SelU